MRKPPLTPDTGSVAYLAAVIIAGFLLTYSWPYRLPLLLRLSLAAPLGVAWSGHLSFALAHLSGLTPLTLLLTLAGMFLPLWFLLRGKWGLMGAEFRGFQLRRFALLLHIALLTALLGRFFDRAVFETPQTIATAVYDNFADLAYHLGFIENFARGNNFPPEHPMYAGARLTYPFLTDFHVASLMVAGMRRADALLAQNVLLMLGFAGLLFAFAVRVTRKRIAGFVAPWLLFLCGGLGFLLVLPEAREMGRSLGEMLTDLPHDYSHWEQSLHFGNSLVYWFSTMRGMLLGGPFLVILWWLWWDAFQTVDPLRFRRCLMAAGLICGLLPLAHTHSFLSTITLGGIFALLGREKGNRWDAVWWKGWFWFFAIALTLAAPQMALLVMGSATRPGTFMGMAIGWMAEEAQTDPATYWLLNTGLFLPTLLLAMLWRHQGRTLARPSLLRFYAPFLLCFLAPNIFKFAPWAWDNIKILYVWFLASLPLVALFIARLWESRTLGARAVAMTLFLLLTLSGGLDVWRVVQGKNSWDIFDADALAFSEMAAKVTPPRSVILCAPVHNQPILLSGRIGYMNYGGFLWTNGLPYEEREQEVRTLYQGGAAADTLLKSRRIHFVVVGPQERDWAKEQQLPLNEAYFSRFPLVARYKQWKLYRVNPEVNPGGKGRL